MPNAVTRRSLLAASAAGLLGPAGARAATVANFSYQQSSALLLSLKAKGSLEAPFAARGAQVAWHEFARILDAMVSDAVQFHGDVADAVPIFAQAARAPLTYYAMERASPHAEALIVPEASPVREVGDLRGRTVAFSRGSGCHYLALEALRRAGLGMNDVQPAYLEAADGAAAFQAGRIDAWCIWDPYLAITQAKAPVRVLADGTGITSYNRYYMVDTGFAQAHPELVRIAFDALAEAGRTLRTDPGAARALLAPIWGGVPGEVIDVVARRRSYDVQPVGPEALAEQARMAEAFHAAGLIPRALDPHDVPVWHPDAS